MKITFTAILVGGTINRHKVIANTFFLGEMPLLRWCAVDPHQGGKVGAKGGIQIQPRIPCSG